MGIGIFKPFHISEMIKATTKLLESDWDFFKELMENCTQTRLNYKT